MQLNFGNLQCTSYVRACSAYDACEFSCSGGTYVLMLRAGAASVYVRNVPDLLAVIDL